MAVLSPPMTKPNRPSNDNWLKSNLAALGSAAVIGVYAAGYVKTEAAAARVSDDVTPRRPVARAPISPVPIASTPTPISTPTSTPHSDSPRHLPRANAAATTTKPAKRDSIVVVPAAAAAASVDTAAPTTPPPIQQQQQQQQQQQAQQPQPAADTTHVAGYKDGVFSGWGTSRHGDIEATVEIKGGKIVQAMITQCLTRYSCSWISALPPQVIERQSAEVDYVSGATQSTNAFYGAVVQALTKAK
ncbi:MAG TPA: FMN-binding protein [Gemmatimonadaceae bacterium]|nr:FMN-binding protein [Gemmatimonadaceae bacterium]